MDYIILEKDGDWWYDNLGLYDTIEDAEKEISTIIEDLPSLKRDHYHIIPNDGKAIKKYRPLDRGNRIFNK